MLRKMGRGGVGDMVGEMKDGVGGEEGKSECGFELF